MSGSPTGLSPGEKATDYRQLTIRLPDETLAALNADRRHPSPLRRAVDHLRRRDTGGVIAAEPRRDGNSDGGQRHSSLNDLTLYDDYGTPVNPNPEFARAH
jgi:hypothetical protein